MDEFPNHTTTLIYIFLHPLWVNLFWTWRSTNRWLVTKISLTAQASVLQWTVCRFSLKKANICWAGKEGLVSFLWEIRMQIKVEIICKFSSQSWKWGHVQNHQRFSQSLGVTWNLAFIGRRISQDASLFLRDLHCHSLQITGESPTGY